MIFTPVFLDEKQCSLTHSCIVVKANLEHCYNGDRTRPNLYEKTSFCS